MEIFRAEKVRITQKYGLEPYFMGEISEEERSHLLVGDLGLTVYIKGIAYPVVPSWELVRKNKISEDGNYHFIYIQINVETGDYYVGKVNRKKWKEVDRYQGSGIRFVNSYKKHESSFVRYHILACTSAKESEEREAEIVDEELLEDPFCLNIVRGGAGTTNHSTEESREKKRQYQKEHPENYQKMMEMARKLYCSNKESIELIKRNKAIKETMSSDEYREMSSKRIKNWKDSNPQAYAVSRENNKIAMQSKESKDKRNASLEKWRKENPEIYNEYKHKLIKAQHAPEAEKKRIASLKAFNKEHPEVARKRSEASAQKCRKAVNMIDLDTKEVLKRFESIQEAAEWLVSQGKAKNINCKASICGVCVKRSEPGHGTKKSAYGYGWEHAEK